jgi:hypothetical protein
MQYENKGLNDGTTLVININDMTVADNISDSVDWAEYQDRSVQVTGTFGAGGSAVVEGSNDGVVYLPLTNASGGTALSFNSAGIKQVLEASRFMRIRVASGDGSTNLKASIFLRRASSIRT